MESNNSTENEKITEIHSEKEREQFLNSMGIATDEQLRKRRYIILVMIVCLLIASIAYCYMDNKEVFYQMFPML